MRKAQRSPRDLELDMKTEEKRSKQQVETWAFRLRLMYKMGVMLKAHQSALEAIPGWRWITGTEITGRVGSSG